MAAVICAILLGAPSAATSQEADAAAESRSAPDAPATRMLEQREEERARRPFFPSEASPATSLLRGAAPELRSSDRLPLDALESFPRSDQLLRAGSFAILPRVQVSGAYDDNVNASDSDREDDFSANVSGSLRAESLFQRHSLGFGADFSVNDVDESVDQDSVDWQVGADGRLDLTPRSALSAAATFTRGSQSPESTEAGAQEEPTVTEADGAIAYTQRLRRLAWEIAGGIGRVEADGDSADDLGTDDAAEQDRTTYTIEPGATYEVSRRVSLFGDLRYENNDYDVAGDGGSRDSQLFEANVGTGFDLGRTFSASLGAGYLGVIFEDPERDNTHSPTFSAALDGAISLDRVTLLRMGLDHSTDLTTAEEAALVTETAFATSISRSLSRTSAIVAGARLSRSDFIDTDRTDYDVVARLGYSRILVRNVALNVGYRFSQRFSDESEADFYRNIVSLGLSASF